MGEQQKVEMNSYPWEENMIDELSKKHGISDNVVLDVLMTCLLNEINAMCAGKDCILKDAMHTKFDVESNLKTMIQGYIAGLTPEQRKRMADAIVTPNN